MKKNIIVYIGIVLLSAVTLFYGCKKDDNSMQNGSTENQEAQTKDRPRVRIEPIRPHFLWHRSQTAPCISTFGYFCGCDIDATLTGDEVCWLERYENDPFGHLTFYFPINFLLRNNADELVDSARNGFVTFFDDCEFLSVDLIKSTGVELIPSGRYAASIVACENDSAVCINFGPVLK